ncbi:MAG: M10 family metallopeptidase C-terminal domain-containing protein [Pseudomonadota bacterium]
MLHKEGDPHCACPGCMGHVAENSDPVKTGTDGAQQAPYFNDSQVVGQLNSGATWSGSSISYSFLQTSPWWDVNYEGQSMSAFNSNQVAATREIMGLWDDLIAPSLVEQNTSREYADIKLANTSSYINYAHAYYPGDHLWAGEIWLNAPTYTGLYYPDPGDYYYLTIMHEAGHALGLSHPGAYNGGSPTYANNAEYAQDTHQWTVMSYFSASNTGADWNGGTGWQYAQTPMVHDVLAIQAMYGADTTTRTGNTVYGFNSTAGRSVFDFSTNQAPVLTIYDAGGIDTLDLSGFSQRAVVNLNPGTYSSAGGTTSSMTYNIGIAVGTIIENAYGGSGDDVITGNYANNHLKGNGGDDKLTGFGGNDILEGGSGNDWANFSGGIANYLINATETYFEIIGEGHDTVYMDVENFSFAGLFYTLEYMIQEFGVLELETDGDYALKREFRQYVIEDAAENTINISYLGLPVVTGFNGQWTPLHVEENGSGGFQLLWTNASGDFNLWQLDGSGAYVSDIVFSQSEITDYEAEFEADLNGDGTIGRVVTVLEDDGDLDLLSESGVRYLIREAGGNTTGIYYNGKALAPGAFGGWSATHVEANGSGGFDVILHNAVDNQHALWELDSNGNYLSSHLLEGSSLFHYETVFGDDLSGDGTVGFSRTVVESSAGHQLFSLSSGTYLIRDSHGAEVPIRYGGAELQAGAFGGWHAVQVEGRTGGGFDLLLAHPPSGQHALWVLDESGNYQSSTLLDGNGLRAWESVFDYDVDGDGNTGHYVTESETSGDHALVFNSATGFMIRDASLNTVAISYGGTVLQPDAFGGWNAVQAEDRTGGGFDLLLHHAESGDYAHWILGAGGDYQSSALVTDTEILDQEEVFQADLDGDGRIGHFTETIESDGQDTLLHHSRDGYRVLESGGDEVQVTYQGNALNAGAFGGWSATQVEERDTGGYDLLLHHAESDLYAWWGLDASGEYQASGLVGSQALKDFEELFLSDIDGDGNAGHVETIIEAVGDTDLLYSTREHYIIREGATDTVIMYDGNELRAGAFGGWDAVHAEAKTDGFEVLLENAGQYAIWELDSDGNYQASRLLTVDEIPYYESVFEFDIDSNGSIAAAPPPIGLLAEDDAPLV